MFDFSKIKSHHANNDLSLFQNQYTELQKSAILGALIVVAKSDGEVHPKEFKKIEDTATLLGTDMSDPVHLAVIQSKSEMIFVLNTLSISQKEWFLVCLHEMVLTDGKVQDIEVAFALGFAKDLGFSEDNYFKVIEKAAAIVQIYRHS
jgi:uncharacterized tellurite resistance protein B-like protein